MVMFMSAFGIARSHSYLLEQRENIMMVLIARPSLSSPISLSLSLSLITILKHILEEMNNLDFR